MEIRPFVSEMKQHMYRHTTDAPYPICVTLTSCKKRLIR